MQFDRTHIARRKDTGGAVEPGTEIPAAEGARPRILVGITRPAEGNSSGRVIVRDADGDEREVFPHVVGLEVFERPDGHTRVRNLTALNAKAIRELGLAPTVGVTFAVFEGTAAQALVWVRRSMDRLNPADVRRGMLRAVVRKLADPDSPHVVVQSAD